MKLPLVFFLLVSSPIKAQSETLIQSQNLTTVDYQALLQTGKYKSYVTHLLAKRTQPDPKLHETFLQAQSDFAQGRFRQARSGYEHIVATSKTRHFNKSERRRVFHSYLRLADIQTSELEKLNLLQQGWNYTKEFPKDIEQYSSYSYMIPRLHNRKLWDLQNGMDSLDVDIVLINGQSFQPNQSIPIYSDHVVISLISNKFQPIDTSTPTLELESMVFEPSPLAQGSCEGFEAFVQPESQPLHIAFSKDCIHPINQARRLNLNPDGLLEQTDAEPDLLSQVTTQKPFYQRPWFWGLIGAAVAAVVIHKQNDEAPTRTVVTPTHR